MRKHVETWVIVGLLIWLGVIGGSVMLARRTISQAPSATSQLANFLGEQRYDLQIKFDSPRIVRHGDLVFMADATEYEPIGFVSRVDSKTSTEKNPVWTETAFVTFYGGAPRIAVGDEMFYHEAEQSTEWVLKTMLPPGKRAEIAQLIIASYSKNQSEIVKAIRPIVEDSLREASQILKQDFKNAIEARNERLQKIGDRYQAELVEQQFVPLIRDEIWPIVQKESEPLAVEIGQQIWKQVSMFRFGWRLLVDKSGAMEEKLAAAEFKRFVADEAIPILLAHTNELVDLQQTIVARVSKNEKVRETMSDSVRKVLNDPEIQTILTEVFQEVFVDNKRLRQALDDHWRSPQARAALDLTASRLEPTINEIGIALFGSPSTKITPEFASVLRHRILHKDERWLTLKLNGANGAANRDGRVTPKPDFVKVQIADPVGVIPYAPARKRN